MDRRTIDGVPGSYLITRVRGFNVVQYRPPEGGLQLLANVPIGQYAGPGNPGAPNLAPVGNHHASDMINEAINKHAKSLG